MSSGYSGERMNQRQRVCPKCKSFVTHEKVDKNQYACPLCGHRIDGPPVRVNRISAAEIVEIVAASEKNRKITKY